MGVDPAGCLILIDMALDPVPCRHGTGSSAMSTWHLIHVELIRKDTLTCIFGMQIN